MAHGEGAPGVRFAEELPGGIEPYSKDPSEQEPYAVCPPPTKVRASCLAAVVPTEHGQPAIGPSLEGSGKLGGFSPADLRSAYKLPAEGGEGQTVAITIAYDDPNAESDLATYRSLYGLPPCTTANGCFKKVNQIGEAENYPKPNAEWALETSLDLDMVSAICPQCHILLVEADSNYFEDLGVAVDTAAELGATAISNSWGADQFPEETAENHYFDHPGTPTLFASGDSGYGVSYPAASPDVVAVGGTNLKKDASKRGWSETAWSGAGSGCSGYEEKPAWQKDAGCATRSVADVSAVSDPATPVSVYDSYKESGWLLLGGTSVATPIMAGVETLSSSAFRSVGPGAFARAGSGGQLFDVVEGENGACGTESEGGFDATYLCQADVGYDGPTGWGSPNGPQSLPVAITEAATIASASKAVLHGSVDPKGLATEYRFEYGETTAYGTSVPIPDGGAGSGSGYVEVSQALEGLKGQTPYHYRVVAKNTAGTFHGVDRIFGTTPPTATTGTADEIHVSTATLHATVNPEGLETSYYFEYGPSTPYEFKVPVRAGGIGSGTKSIGVGTAISGLAGGETYHYRVAAKNVAGVVHGNDKVFTTVPGQWIAETLPQPPNSGNGHEAYSVSCVQATQCIAVGGNWSLNVHTKVTLAEIWNGKSWSVMTTPNPPGLDEGWQHEWYAVLRGVSCISASECVAVGRYRDPEEVVKPLVERWDGSKWTMVAAPTPSSTGATAGRLEGVSCTSSTACTAVGFYESSSGVVKTLAESWDGSKWSIETTTNPGGNSGSRFLGVSCSDATACTAVGFVHGLDAEATLAERWNGTEWATQATIDPGGISPSNRFSGVSCSSANACTAVGRHEYKVGTEFHLAALAERWDGSKWSLQAIPEPVSSDNSELSGVSCASASSCTSVGSYDSVVASESSAEVLGERWDGATWSVLEMALLPDPPEWWHERWLRGVSCAKAEACTAVGEGLSAPSGGLSPLRALAEHEVMSGLTASFSANPGSPLAGESVSFDASSSGGSGHNIDSYSWDFGDSSSGTGAKPSHTYAHAGEYTVTLTVTDDEGQSAKVSHPVKVANAAPLASFLIGTPSPTAAQPVSFDGSASSDPDGNIASYSWDFGDSTSGTGAKPSHTYAHAGEYTVTLTVTDDEGQSASTQNPVLVAQPISEFSFRARTRCDGRIALTLRAPGSGAFAATSTASPAPFAAARTAAKELLHQGSVCGAKPRATAGNYAIARPGDRHSSKGRSFRYGSGTATAFAPGAVQLMIEPLAGARRALNEHGQLRVRIAIGFTPLGGDLLTKRTTLVVRSR